MVSTIARNTTIHDSYGYPPVKRIFTHPAEFCSHPINTLSRTDQCRRMR
jgi:hypothetical protein